MSVARWGVFLVVLVVVAVGSLVQAQRRATSWREATASKSWREATASKSWREATGSIGIGVDSREPVASWSPIVKDVVGNVFGSLPAVLSSREWLGGTPRPGSRGLAARGEWRRLAERQLVEFRAWRFELRSRYAEARDERLVPRRDNECYKPHPECEAWTNGACPYVARTGHYPVLDERCFWEWERRERQRKSESIRREFDISLKQHLQRWRRECGDLARLYPEDEPSKRPWTCG